MPRLSTGYPPNGCVLHSFIPIFGAKVVEKGIVRESSVQVHLFYQRLLALGSSFIIGLCLFVRQREEKEAWFAFTGHVLPFSVEKCSPFW
jgi:hypothetical protein